MHFTLVDRVLEESPERVVAVKLVSAAEEYLQDHFPTFPVLPGVMMLEAMVQAGRVLASRRGLQGRWVLGGVQALRYGRFVRPGDTLRLTVSPHRADDAKLECTGKGEVVLPDGSTDVAVSGRFTLRPVRIPELSTT